MSQPFQIEEVNGDELKAGDVIYLGKGSTWAPVLSLNEQTIVLTDGRTNWPLTNISNGRLIKDQRYLRLVESPEVKAKRVGLLEYIKHLEEELSGAQQDIASALL